MKIKVESKNKTIFKRQKLINYLMNFRKNNIKLFLPENTIAKSE